MGKTVLQSYLKFIDWDIQQKKKMKNWGYFDSTLLWYTYIMLDFPILVLLPLPLHHPLLLHFPLLLPLLHLAPRFPLPLESLSLLEFLFLLEPLSHSLEVDFLVLDLPSGCTAYRAADQSGHQNSEGKWLLPHHSDDEVLRRLCCRRHTSGNFR